MTRNYLCLMLLAVVLPASAFVATTRVERGNLIFDGIPSAPPEMAETLDRYLGGRAATPLSWSPKGALLIATRFGDVDQLHLVERAGGERQQLTFLHEPIDEAAFSPDPARDAYVFLEDAGGGDNAQIYFERSGDPTLKRITDGRSRNGGAVWSNSGREVAFFSTARDGVDSDIDIVEPATGAAPHLAVTGDGAAWRPLDWSPDDRKLLVLKTVSSHEGYLYIVDLSSGQKREVDPSPNKVAVTGGRFSRDGQGVYFISDRDTEFKKLRYVNLFTGDKQIVSASIPWDIEELALSRDGRYLAFTSNEGGVGKLNALDLRSHQDLTPPKLPAPGIIHHLNFAPDGGRLAFGYSSDNRPDDAYVLDLAQNRVEPWTHSETGAVDLTRFVLPRLTQFPTFDRQEGRARQLPVYVYEPASPGPHPVLIQLNGGPESQFRPAFDPWIQYLVVEMGFVVVAPNVRGSSGYGKSYAALDNGTMRDDAVKDLGALLVWLRTQTKFDSGHVAVAGESYGGYLALAALVNYGDRLSGGIDAGGISDFLSFLATTPAYRQGRWRAEYGDEREPDMRSYLRRISPLTNADRMLRPLLVVHGKNDAVVPLSESEQLVSRLRSRGGDVWYLEARDEGRIFRKKVNRDAYYLTFAQFLATLR